MDQMTFDTDAPSSSSFVGEQVSFLFKSFEEQPSNHSRRGASSTDTKNQRERMTGVDKGQSQRRTREVSRLYFLVTEMLPVICIDIKNPSG